jgi:hypothetical protein
MTAPMLAVPRETAPAFVRRAPARYGKSGSPDVLPPFCPSQRVCSHGSGGMASDARSSYMGRSAVYLDRNFRAQDAAIAGQRWQPRQAKVGKVESWYLAAHS